MKAAPFSQLGGLGEICKVQSSCAGEEDKEEEMFPLFYTWLCSVTDSCSTETQERNSSSELGADRCDSDTSLFLPPSGDTLKRQHQKH